MLLPEPNNDLALINLLLEGNLQAFDQLYWKYHKALYNNILKITRDTGVAEDLLQETFITFWQKRSTLQSNKSIAGWLFVISYNKAVNWQRKQLLESKFQQLMSETPQEENSGYSYEIQMKLLEDAMAQLSPQKRKVLVLCKLEGKTYEETAAEMNISRHTVKEYLGGAMASVKEYANNHPEYKSVLPLILMIEGIYY